MVCRTSLPEGDSAGRLRAGSCAFLRLNGLLARELAKLHRDYFRWLDCDARPAP